MHVPPQSPNSPPIPNSPSNSTDFFYSNSTDDRKQNRLSIAKFNVRGLTKQNIQLQLTRDAERYGTDIICLQETKIKKGLDKNICDEYRLISLPTNQRHYGNGFLVSKRVQIHRYWKVSDRIPVLQVKLEPDGNPEITNPLQKKYRSKRIMNGRKLVITEKPPNHVATIINAYAPTTKRAIQQIDELDKFYTQVSDLVNSYKHLATSMLFVAGDFTPRLER